MHVILFPVFYLCLLFAGVCKMFKFLVLLHTAQSHFDGVGWGGWHINLTHKYVKIINSVMKKDNIYMSPIPGT